MFILSKRTVSDENGRIHHSIHGATRSVETARAWYRSTRTTDIIELPEENTIGEWDHMISGSAEKHPQPWAAIHHALISENRFISWREMQAKHDVEIARCIK